MQQQAPVPAGLPPKPVAANAQNQPGEKGRQQETSEASTQSQEQQQGTPQATSTPGQQPAGPASSPTRASGRAPESTLREQNLQTKKPIQQGTNVPHEQAGRFEAPSASPTPQRSSESQNERREGPSSTSSPSDTRRVEKPAPAESSPTPRGSIERRETGTSDY